MTTYNFDELVERRGTNSLKYDMLKSRFGAEDILPMWVADMDFRTPDFISNALIERINQGVLGYSYKPKSSDEALSKWWKHYHNWEIKPEWIIDAPGVVPSLDYIIQAYTKPGEKIIVQPPVYYPFFMVVENNNRQLVCNDLVEENGQLKMDFDALEKQMDEETGLFILCNPHNPGGKVWAKEDLEKLVELCLKNNVLIISDEIHADLVFPGKKHIPLATLSKEAADITITCISASKTFNIAGLGISSMIITNGKLRRTMKQFMEKLHLGVYDVLAHTAVEAAFTHGHEWHAQLMEYIKGNLEFLLGYFQKEIPQIVPMVPEATYLVWLNCKQLGFSNADLKQFMIEQAKIGLNDGPTFRNGGEGYQRINIAAPRKTLEDGLQRIKDAVESL